MVCNKLRDCFLRAAKSTDESVLGEIEKASLRALGLFKTQGKALIDIFRMAEAAQSVKELTSIFDSVNQVMLFFCLMCMVIIALNLLSGGLRTWELLLVLLDPCKELVHCAKQ